MPAVSERTEKQIKAVSFNMKIAPEKKVDFDMPDYNRETLEAMQEALDIEAGKIQAKRYHSADELFAEIDAEIANENSDYA